MVHIKWAPLTVSPRRRMQTLSVAVHLFLFLFGVFSHFLIIILLLFSNVYIKVFVVLYTTWIFMDRKRAQNSVRGSGVLWMRNNCFGKYFRDYFPVELVKTADLPPDRNYLLGCFPHGVLSIGLFTNMCIDISKWNELFPKVRPHMSTLAMGFNAPIWTHLIQAWGMISVTKRSLLNNLMKSQDPEEPVNADGYTASAVGVVVGGAHEALDAIPGKYILTIKNRKGFVKLALQSGAAIVPVFSFGEVEVYNQINNPPGSVLRKIQTCIKKITGVSPVLFIGRGFFQYTFGLLPQRKRIVLVVGSPIHVIKTDDPKEEEINKLHEYFMECLNNLFESHKSKYIENSENVTLIMK